MALLLFAMWHMDRQRKDAYLLGRVATIVRLPLVFTTLVLIGQAHALDAANPSFTTVG